MKRPNHIKMSGVTAAAVIAAFGVWSPAHSAPSASEVCLELTQQLAAQLKLTIDPPNASTSPDVPAGQSDLLARSDGLLEPPPTNDPVAIAPPDASDSNMPTLPDTEDDTAEAGGRLSASELLIVESILIAARNDARNRRPEQCVEKLEQARQYMTGTN